MASIGQPKTEAQELPQISATKSYLSTSIGTPGYFEDLYPFLFKKIKLLKDIQERHYLECI